MTQSGGNGQPIPLGGEIWLVRIPTHPNDQHQPRPVVITSLNELTDNECVIASTTAQNRDLNIVLVIPLSSTLGTAANTLIHILISKSESGMTKDAHARCELITSVDKSLLIRRLGSSKLSSARRLELVKGVRRALGESVT